MAVLVHLVCHTCKEEACLGKWLRDQRHVGFGFWRGGTEYGDLGLKALNFVAWHVNHKVEVLTDYRFDELNRSEYRNIEDELRPDWPAAARRE